MTNKRIRWLGVREESRTISALLFNQKHNRNKAFRHTLSNIQYPELTDHNVDISGISIKEHYRRIDEYNSKFPKKSRKRLEHIREQQRHIYFDTENNTEIKSKDYDKNNSNHIKKSVDAKWKANQTSIEQVLYFSNTINDEPIDKEDWQRLMLNWSAHMKKKHGRDLISTTLRLEELSIHFHAEFSCLSIDENNNVVYQNPKIRNSGYGSSLQDDFEKIFNESIDQSKFDNKYSRGIGKLPFKDIGDDHTPTKKYKEQIDALDEIQSMSGELSIVETLKNLRNIKNNFKGNSDALAILNKIQSGYKKLLKTEQKLNDEQKQFQIKIKDIENDLESVDDLIEFIDNNDTVKKSIIKFGGKRVLNDVGIETEFGTQAHRQHIKKQ